MKLEEAAEVLQTMLSDAERPKTQRCVDALILGIDAIERIQHFRHRPLFTVRSPLLHEEAEPRRPRLESA